MRERLVHPSGYVAVFLIAENAEKDKCELLAKAKIEKAEDTEHKLIHEFAARARYDVSRTESVSLEIAFLVLTKKKGG